MKRSSPFFSTLLLLLFFIIAFSFPSFTLADKIGVDDDYQLEAPVDFSCPWAINPASINRTDDGGGSGDDDYYGSGPVSANYSGFVFFYVWMVYITLAPLAYFAYNNKINPIGDVKPFTPESKRQNTFFPF